MKPHLALPVVLMVATISRAEIAPDGALRDLPLADVHSHVFSKTPDGPLSIIALARREHLKRVYLICPEYKTQVDIVRKNGDIARMIMQPRVGGKGWWKNEEPFILRNRDCVSGVKLLPSSDNYRVSTENMSDLFESAQKHGFVIVSHTDSGDNSNAANFAPLLARFPQTRLVLYHATPIDKALQLITGYPNVYADISSTSFDRNIQQQLLAKAGSDKIVFGIDTPLGWPKDSTGAIAPHYRDVILEIAPWYNKDIPVMRKILYDNSERLFNSFH